MDKSKEFDLTHIKQFMEGDKSAFDQLYTQYQKHVYYVGMQMFNEDEERAKDLVQNTFSEVYRCIANLQSAEAFFVWLSKIAYQQGCNMLRYQSKDASYYASNDEEVIARVVDAKSRDALTQLSYDETISLILNELKLMSPNKRLIGYLRYFDELSIKEISEITNVKESTVISHLHRIKARLKKMLIEKGYTNSACVAFIAFPSMHHYFDLMQSKMPYHPQSLKKKQSRKIKQTSTSIMTSALAISCVAAIVALPMIKEANTSRDTLSDYAKITQVNYDTNFTNEAVKLDVQTTNNNYDKILVNNRNQLVCDQNGEYIISLLKGEQVIDERKITIQNIDEEAPELVNYVMDDTFVTFSIQDDASGIDYALLNEQVKKNNMILVSANDEQRSVTLQWPKKQSGDFVVVDKAGNHLNVSAKLVVKETSINSDGVNNAGE